ncbi:MAG: KpsF/GutQ family sugar-phosphate isomerase [Kiritimatiellae bacterium]|nr:KpsF/GutQ family sugar-phosphate isomerase [Kiritimatiellia bacterium]
MTNDEMLARAHEVIATEIDGLHKTDAGLDATFCEIAKAILTTLEQGGKLVVTGVGKNIHVGEKIAATMASTGTTAVLLNPVQAMHGDLGMVTEKDIVLAISFSGESDEVIRLLPSLRRIGVKIIGMTGNKTSSLAKDSDWVYYIDCGPEACPFNMAPTTSTTATLALGDALAMVLLEARGFKKENFALYHPAGAIGRALLFRVKDIMRTGDRLVSLTESATVQDAVVAMTSAKSGCACVVDAAGKLLGIFTDGDLRRLLSDPASAPMARKLTEVMIHNPISVSLGALAVEVLHIFEHHKVDDLPVVDAEGCLVGTIDIQDLPRMKIL